MRQMTVLAALLLGAVSGCGAAKSALGALGGGKPTQVTVINNVTPVAAAAPGTVAAAPAPERKQPSAVVAVAGGTVAGALVGGVVGVARGKGPLGVDTLVGAGAGAVAGYVVHVTEN